MTAQPDIPPEASVNGSAPDFERFLRTLRAAVATRIAADWADHRESLFELGKSFIDRSRSDLERWTGLLAAGALTRSDFDWLVQGRKELAAIESLRRAGLTLAQADRFRAALAETVVATAFRQFV